MKAALLNGCISASMETLSNYRPLILVWKVSYELEKRNCRFHEKSNLIFKYSDESSVLKIKVAGLKAMNFLGSHSKNQFYYFLPSTLVFQVSW